jgi:hypothetical protein
MEKFETQEMIRMAHHAMIGARQDWIEPDASEYDDEGIYRGPDWEAEEAEREAEEAEREAEKEEYWREELADMARQEYREGLASIKYYGEDDYDAEGWE